MYDYYKELNVKNLKGKIIALLLIAAAIAGIVATCRVYMNVIQLDELGGFSGVYIKNLIYKLIFAAGAFVLIFIAASVTNRFVKKNFNRYLEQNSLPARKMPNLLLSLIIGVIGAFISRDFFYDKALSFINSTVFDKTVPLFDSLDIGYFIFQRPFYISIYQFVSSLWMFIILYTAAYYIIMFLLVFNNVTLQDMKVKSILRHNIINIAVFFLIKAVTYRFQKEGLLYSDFFDVKGAGYVDVNVWMNYFSVAPFLLAAIVAVAFWFMWKEKMRMAVYSIAVFPAVWVVVAIISMVVHGVIVKPNEVQMERPYLRYNMQQTRAAYGLDKIKSHDFPEMKELTPEIINRNLETKNNIRIVDYDATLRSNIQLQSNTNFYTFKNGDIVNYVVNGKEIPVFLTARETDKSKLPENSYINRVFRYTHGYGLVINPINKLTEQGQVDFLLSGLRMDSVDKENLNLTEPRLYYGEMTNDYVIVNPEGSGKLREIDYDGSTETNYSGGGGIKLSMFNRALFALQYADINMIISGNISSESKLLLNRNVIDRAQMAVPFITIDQDPCIVITSDGRLKWVLDGYTTTNYYPYSQSMGSYNYIRNSVKLTVDAYDGTVECYVIDSSDPIISTYVKMYPGIFKDGPIPEDISNHMRYPEALFQVQTEVLKRYHIDPDSQERDNISVFYGNQDRWDIAKYPDKSSPDGIKDIEPYYNMIKLPGDLGTKEELILMRPFTPSGEKNNMVSWLAVRNSSSSYGEMVLFNFPKNTNILGPDQVEVNINQIGEISESITLWGQNGSEVFKGSLLVIPIEDSVLYVEPVYIKSSRNSSIPQVRKIVVGYQQENDFKYGVGNTLDAALENLFKGISDTPVKPDDSNVPADEAVPSEEAGNDGKQKIIDNITSKYNDMKQQLDELGELIEELNK